VLVVAAVCVMITNGTIAFPGSPAVELRRAKIAKEIASLNAARERYELEAAEQRARKELGVLRAKEQQEEVLDRMLHKALLKGGA